MADKSLLKRAVIAGASEALKYKEENTRASDEEVLKHITNKAKEIADNID